MPRYFFDIEDDHTLVPDVDGSEHADIQAVVAETTKITADLLDDRSVNGRLKGTRLVTTVVDEQDKVVLIQGTFAPAHARPFPPLALVA